MFIYVNNSLCDFVENYKTFSCKYIYKMMMMNNNRSTYEFNGEYYKSYMWVSIAVHNSKKYNNHKKKLTFIWHMHRHKILLNNGRRLKNHLPKNRQE